MVEATLHVILIPMACAKCPKVIRLTDSTVVALTRWAESSSVHGKREQRGGHEAALSGPVHDKLQIYLIGTGAGTKRKFAVRPAYLYIYDQTLTLTLK